MKTYRKRFMASTLALLMTVSIPLTALAEGTGSNGSTIIQESNEQPVSDPSGAPTIPSTDEINNAKEELEQAINNAEAFQLDEKYTKGLEADKNAFKEALKAAKTAKDAPGATVDSLTNAKNTLTAAQKKLADATLPIASTLVISGQKVSSNGYVSGYVKADGLAVEGAKVTFYTNDGVYVNDGNTNANGYFEFKVGTEYYNYYYDDYYKDHKVYYDSTYGYYYRNSNNDRVYINDYYWYGKDYRCGKSGYLLASLTGYETSEKAYVTGSCDYNNYYWQGSYDNKYYDYRVYPTSVSRTTSYVKGYLPNEKGRTVSVYSNDYYYDGYYSDGYYDYNGSWHYYNDSNGYYNRYNRNSNYYLGSATVDSDGYFTIYFNRSVPTSESLYYYVDGYKDGRYATIPSVSQAEAGTMLIKGKAGSFASIRVEDAKVQKLEQLLLIVTANFLVI